jgi:hypothetical protein
MALLSRGRLSVQPVSETAYEAIVKLGEQGDFDQLLKIKRPVKPRKRKSEAVEDPVEEDDEVAEPASKRSTRRGKSKKSYAEEEDELDAEE